MKKICFILIFVFLSNSLKSDVFICIFNDTINKIKVTETIKKESNKYFMYYKDRKFPVLKTFESDIFIHFVISIDTFLMGTIINKKTNDAKKVFMQMGKDYGQSISFGKCNFP